MKFTWDPQKATTNLRKHGVAFEDAARVFLDVNRLEVYDGREPYGEDRWKTVGWVSSTVLAVIYTVRGTDGETVRLISARKADANERKQYG